jgi:hypothetical protein
LHTGTAQVVALPGHVQAPVTGAHAVAAHWVSAPLPAWQSGRQQTPPMQTFDVQVPPLTHPVLPTLSLQRPAAQVLVFLSHVDPT